MPTSSNMELFKIYPLKGLLPFQVRSPASTPLKLDALNATLDTVVRVREFILNNPDILNDKAAWIRGGGWDHTIWPSAGWPSAVGSLAFVTSSLDPYVAVRRRILMRTHLFVDGPWSCKARIAMPSGSPRRP